MDMKKYFFVIIVFTLLKVNAQENSFYGELGGAGPIFSLNYEREVIDDSALLLRIGLGYLSTWSYEGLTIPIGAYHLIDLNKGNHLELGGSYTFGLGRDNDIGTGFFLPAIGYRKYKEGRKGFFKITFNPVLYNDEPIEVIPWGGISYGVRF